MVPGVDPERTDASHPLSHITIIIGDCLSIYCIVGTFSEIFDLGNLVKMAKLKIHQL